VCCGGVNLPKDKACNFLRYEEFINLEVKVCVELKWGEGKKGLGTGAISEGPAKRDLRPPKDAYVKIRNLKSDNRNY